MLQSAGRSGTPLTAAGQLAWQGFDIWRARAAFVETAPR
jgi:hypothetical protein